MSESGYWHLWVGFNTAIRKSIMGYCSSSNSMCESRDTLYEIVLMRILTSGNPSERELDYEILDSVSCMGSVLELIRNPRGHWCKTHRNS